MRIKLNIFITFIIILGFTTINSQNINEYKYIIVPNKFDFLKTEDQYKLNSLTQFLFKKEGFITIFKNDKLPDDLYNNPCLGLNVSLNKKSSLFATILFIELKNCKSETVFTSSKGYSKLKDYKKSYHEALRDAFLDVKSLNYKYDDLIVTKSEIKDNTKSKSTIKKVKNKEINTDNSTIAVTSILYAQKNENGFQLVDNTPKIIYTILKTGKEDTYILKNKTGIVYFKNNEWFIEMYTDKQLVIKNLNIKF